MNSSTRRSPEPTPRDDGGPGHVLIRYARAVDARDWQALERCFSPDATVQGTLQQSDIAPYLEFMRSSLDAYSSTMHVMANQHIEWTADGDHAHVETYALAYHVAREATDRAPTLTMGVVYEDDMVYHESDGWRISHRKVTPRWIQGQLPS